MLLNLLILLLGIAISSTFLMFIYFIVAGFFSHKPVLPEQAFVIIYFISLLFSMLIFISPIEVVVAWFKNWKKLTPEETARVRPLFEEVLNSSNKKYGTDYSYDKLNIRVDRVTTDINAFVCYTKTVVIMKYLLDSLNDNQVKGILAHELGHLHYKDTVIGGATMYSYIPSLIVQYIMMAVIWVLDKVMRLFNALGAGILSLFLSIPLLIGYYPLMLANIIMINVLDYFSLFSSRRGEYRADAFADSLGFGIGLKDSLVLMKGEEKKLNNRLVMWWREAHSTHPHLEKRIMKLGK